MTTVDNHSYDELKWTNYLVFKTEQYRKSDPHQVIL